MDTSYDGYSLASYIQKFTAIAPTIKKRNLVCTVVYT